MTNAYYTKSGAPSTSSSLTSSTIRSEFELVEQGFDSVETAVGDYLPLSGGAMTGTPVISGPTGNTGVLEIASGTTDDYAFLELYSHAHATLPGRALLYAADRFLLTVGPTAGDQFNLSALDTGTLSWGGYVGVGITPVNALDVEFSLNGAVVSKVKNANDGASAYAQHAVTSDDGSVLMQMMSTAAGALGLMQYSGSSSLSIYTTSNTPLYIGTNNVNTHVMVATTGYLGVGSLSPTALVHTGASTTARASLCVPHGTAPTAPVNGDIWTDTSAMYVRINGVTKTVAFV